MAFSGVTNYNASNLSGGILLFLRNEASLLSFEVALAARDSLLRLLNRVLIVGLPAHTKPHQNWRDAERSQSFSEVTLLAALNSVTRRIAKESENDAKLTIDITKLNKLILRNIAREGSIVVTSTLFLDHLVFNNSAGVFSSLNKASLVSVKAVKSDISHTNIVGSFIHKADFTQAHLAYSNLRLSIISNSNFTNANLFGALLEGISIVDTDLKNAVFDHARLHNANISKAKNLTQDQINKAFGNSKTVLPDGLDHPSNWENENENENEDQLDY